MGSLAADAELEEADRRLQVSSPSFPPDPKSPRSFLTPSPPPLPPHQNLSNPRILQLQEQNARLKTVVQEMRAEMERLSRERPPAGPTTAADAAAGRDMDRVLAVFREQLRTKERELRETQSQVSVLQASLKVAETEPTRLRETIAKLQAQVDAQAAQVGSGPRSGFLVSAVLASACISFSSTFARWAETTVGCDAIGYAAAHAGAGAAAERAPAGMRPVQHSVYPACRRARGSLC